MPTTGRSLATDGGFGRVDGEEPPMLGSERRRFTLPFGAEIEDGGVRFRLWAPDADRVELCLEGPASATEIALPRGDRGWREVVVPGCGAGTRYRFRIDGGLLVPDAASRAQPDDVHAASEVIDPTAYRWRKPDWRGRPWEEVVLYELHVGTFTPAGTFAGCIEKLDELVDLGITAIELMPVADFPGAGDWGYNGAALFAPDSVYGRPDELKALVDAAHERGLMVFLDVVYNHFGPEGNYISVYDKSFFQTDVDTPWGAAIAFDGPDGDIVRSFFIANALYWLEEYFIDGLRFDAVHAISGDVRSLFLAELAGAVKRSIGDGRHVHLVLENDANEAAPLERDAAGQPAHYTAQWNDDIHHALHVLTTGEHDGYYSDYADRPVAHLGRCLAEGFAYQGDASPFRDGERRGEPSDHLPPTAFVSFLQNHDQIGNRALGERIGRLAPWPKVRAAMAVYLLAPSIPLLFMGEEWAATEPFLFFCDLGPDLAESVREGRRREFGRFPEFATPAGRARIPDPTIAATREASRLDWQKRNRSPHAEALALVRELLAIRRRSIVPRLTGMSRADSRWEQRGDRGLAVRWRLTDGAHLSLIANFGEYRIDGELPPGTCLYGTPGRPGDPWTVHWYLAPGEEERGR
ncbi:MAG: malto-oligosyltrehalose trehalohydrolase [Rhodospirillales bacterium]